MSENQVSKIKPENVVTWLTTAAMVLGAGYVLYNGLPYLNQIIEMGWYAVAAGAPLALLIFVGLNKDVHKIVWYAWKAALRWATGRIIELDPIAIMRGYAEHYDDIISSIREAMNGFRAQIKNLEENIKNGTAQIQRSMTLAARAHAEMANDPTLTTTMELENFKASQYEESNKRFQEMLNFLNKHLETCKSMLEASVFNRQKLETTIIIKSRERDAMLALRKTISAFKRLINGDDELEMFNRAIEAENQFVARTLGEFEQFTDDSQSVLQAGKLDKLANKSDAIARIDAWNAKKIDNLKINTGLRIDKSVATVSPSSDSLESFDDLFDTDYEQTKRVTRINK